ncbi:NAD-dependent DNA ligase LigA [Nannocystis sp. ILAH1]|uniref:NAD-dependent DNA ligase LigA n=1 Tax=Nannocystis sp. ILAH1 TaxID=2996789 RepID=UPI00227123CA|nr:NAD-dependent DNA ligase LigA [Nannocystis sp. ILAH1]MCY0989952.1 NAD-dependent DNA ligase LigA [Nannocystis sp. ILAH1]
MSASTTPASDLQTLDAAAVNARLPSFTADELEVLIRRANKEYWDDHVPTLPDTLYDQLIERLKRLRPDAAVLDEMGPQAAEAPAMDAEEALQLAPEQRFGAAVRHQRPMLSLEKCYNETDLQSWAGKFSSEILVMPKMDGVACSLRYDKKGKLVMAATRGSGTEGEDITMNALEVKDIPRTVASDGVELEVRGELYMKLSDFAKFKGDFANPRNLTAGSIKQKERKNTRNAHLSFFAYDIIGPEFDSERDKFELLKKLGLGGIDHEFVDRAGLQASYDRWARNRPELDYEIDGVVYRTASVKEQRRLGLTGHHPRYAIAYKFQGDSGVTDLLDILWSVSRTGVITPVALLEPVELSGARIGRASLHNLNIFESLGLTHNCRVEVTRRGGVIPNVERVVESGPASRPFDLPTQCPACGGPIERRKKRDGENLWCAEPKKCVQARLGELEHFAKVIDLQGFGPKVIGAAVDAELLSTPADYYRLRAVDLQELERLGEKSAQNLIDQIEAHRELPLAVFLQALGIEHLGKQNALLLAGEFRTLERIRELNQADLTAVRGIKDAIADAIVHGLAARAELIDALLEFVTVLPGEAAPAPVEGAALSGKSFVFTGTLEAFTREVAQARVQALGGEVPSGVTKALSFLVVGAGRGAKSSKQKKAEDLIAAGAPLKILSEEEFLAMVGSLE